MPSRSTWESIIENAAPGSHVALLYRDEPFLVRAVAAWSAPALRAGGGAILVGSPTHAIALRAHLRLSGVDVDGLERNGRLLIVDAEWLMANFILDGTPDGARFRELAREMVRGVKLAAASTGGGVRAWGEMVSLLRMRGNPAAARRLEALWAEAIAEHEIALLCSYEVEGPGGARGAFATDVADAHSDVLLQPGLAEEAVVGGR